MTRDELREQIAKLCHGPYVPWYLAEKRADQILDLIKEAGYLPPEYNIVVLNGVEGAIELLKKKGWKSPEELEERFGDIDKW
jgi:hypothetical protein